MQLQLGEGVTLPFNWTVRRDSIHSAALSIHNGEEVIPVNDVTLKGDSFFARMPLFDSEFIGSIDGDSLITGYWVNHLKGDGYRIPFIARAGKQTRFIKTCSDGPGEFAGNWAARFSPGTSEAYNSIGQFDQLEGGQLTGTFLTETGDYRFLEGTVCGDSMFLSAFDGNHAFLFAGSMSGDSIRGLFWSGTHWQEPWVADRNPDYQLRDPDSLTTMRDGFNRVDFLFKDTDGVEHSPQDPAYAGKPLIVHIMGSWCPNCVDETALLTEMYDRYHAQGLNVLAIAFEKHSDENRAISGLKRFKAVMSVQYPILYGGQAAKDKAAAKLPFLNHLMSYPTCIFIDRNGRVRRIRTGFNGPGTGKHYEDYKQHFESLLKQLIAELPG